MNRSNRKYIFSLLVLCEFYQISLYNLNLYELMYYLNLCYICINQSRSPRLYLHCLCLFLYHWFYHLQFLLIDETIQSHECFI